LQTKEIQVGSLQAEVVVGLVMEPARLVAQVLAEVLMGEQLVMQIQLQRRQIQAVVQVEVLQQLELLVLEVQALFV
jgi:hypothetical protein